MKDYIKEMTLQEARTKFRLRSRTIKCAMNQASDPKNIADLWKCKACMVSIGTQSHILWCPAYKQLREGKSLDNDLDVVQYYLKVVKLREKLNI